VRKGSADVGIKVGQICPRVMTGVLSANDFPLRYCLTKINMGQKWYRYQSIAYDLPLGRLGFILNFKGTVQ
jgi:hypothetical protein